MDTIYSVLTIINVLGKFIYFLLFKAQNNPKLLPCFIGEEMLGLRWESQPNWKPMFFPT